MQGQTAAMQQPVAGQQAHRQNEQNERMHGCSHKTNQIGSGIAARSL